ncbi:hypothetical protein FisN_26Hu082 [Fistulifera solaris]|jgi:hypothetical protein|uniref:DUF6824 domain-containing protein n=1 Tax=Fistulifera solaris TaxID=1519565 RepID=A0A1Z5JXN5_FISSO|nr:hypothetical protein FisN_26Hu082 [Fistulifera solaris]|eukprot:GAX18783.1 hypothetical protein FisN_26Hu082 [Fistulifera solaris]
MEDETRKVAGDEEAKKSLEDESGGLASNSKGQNAAEVISSNPELSVSLTKPSDDSSNADKKLIQDVLKRYTESVEARNQAAGETKKRKHNLQGNAGQPLDSDGDSNRKKQRPLDIVDPLDADVLFGRRDAQRFHPGNVHLRALCDTYRDEYETGDREVKTIVKKRIIDEIACKGGRFLKRRVGDTTWYNVDEEVALEKVAFTMRDTRDRKKSY